MTASNTLKSSGKHQRPGQHVDDPASLLVSIDRLIERQPQQAIGHRQRGDLLSQLGQFKTALASYNQAIGLYSGQTASAADLAQCYLGCGKALYALKQYEFALAHLDYAITLLPDLAAAHYYRGLALQKNRCYAEALSSYQQAIVLQQNDPLQTALNRAPDLAIANMLSDMDRYQEALERYDALLAETPDDALVHNNKANLLRNFKQWQNALWHYEKAIALDPQETQFVWNKALLKLLLGDFAAGWPLYEAGFKTEGFARGLRKQCAQPPWLGEFPVAGKRVLLYAEQGYGDAIQFARYAPLVARLGAQVILEVPKPLMALMQTLCGDSVPAGVLSADAVAPAEPAEKAAWLRIVEQGQPFDDFDVHCPLMSLPLVFNTTLQSIPVDIPYLFADAVRQTRFGLSAAGKMRIGLVWSGSATHNNDHRRSISLEKWRPLLQLQIYCQTLSFHGLQQSARPEEQLLLQQLAPSSLHLHTEQLQDFTDTAALVQAMDLVITVDTSVAHLAGALGKPVWILLPYVPDFRWLLDRADTPWYPTARLFRQQTMGDWGGVLATVTHALEVWLAGKSDTAPAITSRVSGTADDQ